jgi:hypothetical protein
MFFVISSDICGSVVPDGMEADGAGGGEDVEHKGVCL